MTMRILSKTIVGFRFSDICFINKKSKKISYDYLTKEIKKAVAKKFEGGRIYDEEVTPELLSLIFELDSFPFKSGDFDDAIIGIELVYTDIGERNSHFIGFADVEVAKRKVEAHLASISPSIVDHSSHSSSTKKVKIELALITNIE